MPTQTKKAGTTKTKATAKTKKTEKLPARQAALEVLRQEGRPMHYREITKVARDRKIIKVKRGTTLEKQVKTIRSYLAGCAQENVRVVRLDPGVFDLKPEEKKGKAKQASA